MKIVNFGVNNFRCIHGGIEKNTINFDNSNTIFIFGQNNVGKSTFLKAYKNFYEDEDLILDDFFERDKGLEVEMILEVLIDDVDKANIKKVTNKSGYLEEKYLSPDNKLKLKKIWKEVVDATNPKKKNIECVNQTFNPSTRLWDTKSYGGIGLHTVIQSCLPKPILIKAMPTEGEVEDIVNEILASKAQECLDQKELDEFKDAVDALTKLQDKMYNPDRIKAYKEEVNKKFQEMFKDIAIEFEPKDNRKYTLNTLGKKFNVKFNKLLDDSSVNSKIPNSYNDIGHGAVRAAIFALFLLRDIAEGIERKSTFKNYIVLFEEPELFLHPKLTKTLREIIYEVSEDMTPYQVICASHSPQMIDLTKIKSSIIRMTNTIGSTCLYQIDEGFLTDSVGGKQKVKQEIYEALRFNPYICESFYADEVVLIEGDAEAILLRGYFQEKPCKKDIFVLNCGTVNNIPFFQRIFSRFKITYHVICDTDNHVSCENCLYQNATGIQKTILEQYETDKLIQNYHIGIIRMHEITFEPAHIDDSIPLELRFPFPVFNEQGTLIDNDKPYKANQYWKEVLSKHLTHPNIEKVPIIKYIEEIISY